MSRRHISQNEAHRLEKELIVLKRERRCERQAWSREYPGGTSLGEIKRDRDWFAGKLEAARALGFAIVAIPGEDGSIRFDALEPK